MSVLSCWGPLVTLGTAEVGPTGIATYDFNLEIGPYREVMLGAQVVFEATVDGNTTLTTYRGLASGDFIDLVADRTLTFTAVSEGTAGLTTLISDSPYIQLVVSNADSAASVNVVLVAQGHFEQGLDRLI